MNLFAQVTAPTNATSTTLGQVAFADQAWTVEAHLDAARYARYNRTLAEKPALIRVRDFQFISYPVENLDVTPGAYLAHAPMFLVNQHPHYAPPLEWKAGRTSEGRRFHQAAIAILTDASGAIPVFALCGQTLTDNDTSDMVCLVGEGAKRRLFISVASMNTPVSELFLALVKSRIFG